MVCKLLSTDLTNEMDRLTTMFRNDILKMGEMAVSFK
jgi:hypothetical protein